MRKKKSEKKGAVFWRNQRDCFLNSFRHFGKQFWSMYFFDLLTFISIAAWMIISIVVLNIISYKILPFLAEVNNAATEEAAQQILLDAAPDIISHLTYILIGVIVSFLVGLALFCFFNYKAWLLLRNEKPVSNWFWKYYLAHLIIVIILALIGLLLALLIQNDYVGWLLLIELFLLGLFSVIVRAVFNGKIKESFRLAWHDFKRVKNYIIPVIIIILMLIIIFSLLGLIININSTIFTIITIIALLFFIGWGRRYLFFILKRNSNSTG